MGYGAQEMAEEVETYDEYFARLLMHTKRKFQSGMCVRVQNKDGSGFVLPAIPRTCL